LGFTGISTFRPTNDSTAVRPSQFLYSAVYTFKKQLLLFLPFELYTHSNKRRIKGELGYYRYFYNFYGIGAQSRTADLETYQVHFPRIEFSYALTKNRVWYYGAGLKFDNFNITEIQPNGYLSKEQPTGYQGGRKVNLQFLVVRDRRDNIISTHKGSYLEINIEQSLPSFISSFSYRKGAIDFRYFIELKSKLILATRCISSHASATTPFFDLVYISSPKRSRGFSDRRFMSRNITTLQAELRYPLWKKLTGVAFTAPNYIYSGSAFSFTDPAIKMSYGLGLRFELDEKERTKLRLDVARGDGVLNIYLTMNEAF